jgi:hypothetical protein
VSQLAQNPSQFVALNLLTYFKHNNLFLINGLFLTCQTTFFKIKLFLLKWINLVTQSGRIGVFSLDPILKVKVLASSYFENNKTGFDQFQGQ